MAVSIEINQAYLQAELSRIDLKVQHLVRRWLYAGQNQNDRFRGLYVTEADVEALLKCSPGTTPGKTVALPPEEELIHQEKLNQSYKTLQDLIHQAEELGHELRLVSLAAAFDLSAFEYDSLLICVASALDVRYERIFGFLQDDVTRKLPTFNLILNILDEPGQSWLSRLSSFNNQAPLFYYHLIDTVTDTNAGKLSWLSQALAPDPTVLSWLLGNYIPGSDLENRARIIDPKEACIGAESLLPDAALQALEIAPDSLPVLVLHGQDQEGQNSAALLYAARYGRLLLSVNIGSLIRSEMNPADALRTALRDAHLTNAIPYLCDWDACLRQEVVPLNTLLSELCAYPDVIMISGAAAWQVQGLSRQRPFVWIEFPNPEYPQRLQLWQYWLKELPTDADLDLRDLAGQFNLSRAQIRDAVLTARDLSFQATRSIANQDLFYAARAHSNPHLSSLARKIVPRYAWSDIILPADQLEILSEIVSTVRGRPTVLQEWGVGLKLTSSRGITVLFAGPPGTGKTMAAEVMAANLCLDLYKIEISSIISKYIGETEKNLDQIFAEAQSSNAILFFDEADAIFGKRSEVKDAHDRYANIEVSYLLQRMEAYDGITILATNLRANLDEAFTRRLQFAIDFPFPDEADRERIWKTIFPPGVPRDEAIDFGLLAHRFKLAGGNIRNIIVNSAYFAASNGGKVTIQHLLHSTRRELQKMGRLVNEKDFAISELNLHV